MFFVGRRKIYFVFLDGIEMVEEYDLKFLELICMYYYCLVILFFCSYIFYMFYLIFLIFGYFLFEYFSI